MSSVAIVVLDTLRKDTFDRHFDWLTGRRFENAWSTSHWTVPAHASLFTGKYASETGCYARSTYFDSPDQTLAELLSADGYRTRGFSANRHVSPYFNFDRGFDEFESVGIARGYDGRIPRQSVYFHGPRYKRPAQLARVAVGFLRGKFDVGETLVRTSERLYNHYPWFPFSKPCADQAVSYLQEREFADDEFLFMNLMDVHAPYKPPISYQSGRYSTDDLWNHYLYTFEGGPSNSARIERAYEDCARYLSDSLERLLEELDAFDYVIVLSDHGESFGENDVWEHPIGLHPALTRIPLVIRGPDVEPGTVDTPVNLLDVFATVADAAGLSVQTSGRSLLGEFDPQPCMTEYHGLAYEQRLEGVRETGVPERELREVDQPRYGIALSPDYYGYETVDGFTAEGTADREAPRTILEEFESNRPELQRDGVSLDSDVESQLSQLGYL